MSAEQPDLAPPGPSRPDAVEIITIGDELLLGHTIDTNAAFLSRELVGAGFRVTRRTTVGDDESAIAETVSAALERVRFVICTGGLGSTRDDFTRPVVAKLFDAPLELDQRLLEALKERFRLRGIPMTPNNVSQAEVPRGATVLPNRRGTAQGLVLGREDHWCILLPGVPHELRGLTVEQVLPYLLGMGRGRGRERRSIRYRVVRTTGIAESAAAERLEGVLPQIDPLTLAFLPNFAGTDLRITCWGDLDDADAERALESAEQLIRDALDSHIYGTGSADLAEVIGELLRERGLRLSVAESCTGGLLAKRITDIAGSSDYFYGGVVTYANDAKRELLGVSADTLKEHGAVSEAAVQEMVRGALRLDQCQAAMAITGVAGPGGGTPEKPVGTVWIAAAVNHDVQTRKLALLGDREDIRERSAQAALTLMWKLLKPLPMPMPLPLPTT